VEDLHSSNGTHLNGGTIKRQKLKTGDCIGIADFTLQVSLDEGEDVARLAHLEDTIAGVPQEPRIVRRELESAHAPDLKMPAGRAPDFIEASSAVGKAKGPDETLEAILDLLCRQFSAQRAWCGLRYESTGPLAARGGKTEAGEPFHLQDSGMKERTRLAMEGRAFLLVRGTKEVRSESNVRSALIAPLVGPDGNFGVLYLDRGHGSEPYLMSDLDYLMLLSIHLAAVMDNY
jgi:hypothetical protein